MILTVKKKDWKLVNHWRSYKAYKKRAKFFLGHPVSCVYKVTTGKKRGARLILWLPGNPRVYRKLLFTLAWVPFRSWDQQTAVGSERVWQAAWVDTWSRLGQTRRQVVQRSTGTVPRLNRLPTEPCRNEIKTDYQPIARLQYPMRVMQWLTPLLPNLLAGSLSMLRILGYRGGVQSNTNECCSCNRDRVVCSDICTVIIIHAYSVNGVC